MATILSAKYLITANAIIDQPLITLDDETILRYFFPENS